MLVELEVVVVGTDVVVVTEDSSDVVVVVVIEVVVVVVFDVVVVTEVSDLSDVVTEPLTLDVVVLGLVVTGFLDDVLA